MLTTPLKVILTPILPKLSQINLKVICIQKIQKQTFLSKLGYGPFLRDLAHFIFSLLFTLSAMPEVQMVMH